MGDCFLFRVSITFVIYLMIYYQITAMSIFIYKTRIHFVRSCPVEVFLNAENDETFHPINIVGNITIMKVIAVNIIENIVIIGVIIKTAFWFSVFILRKIYPLLKMLLKLNNEAPQVVNV